MVSSKKTTPTEFPLSAPVELPTLTPADAMTTTPTQATAALDITTPPFVRYALAKRAMPVFTKDKSGHGYKYVPLEDIQRAINPILDAHGLILVDELEWVRPQYGLATSLRDQKTGTVLVRSYFQFNIEAQYGVDKRGNPTLSYGTAQDVGGWRTYAARYNRATLLDLCLVGEDDDAASLNRAEGSAPTSERRPPASGVSPITERSNSTSLW